MHTPLARRIARFALTSHALLDAAAVRDVVLRSIVDSLACMLGAADAAPVAAARAAAQAFQAVGSGAHGASIVGGNVRASLEAAAFVNGLAIRYLDFNDIYLSTEAVHPSDAVSVALALAEAHEIDGRAFVAAVASGYEVHCRLADRICTRAGGWDHVVLNAIASAVTAGALLRLNEDQLTQAIAIAATSNVATMQTRVGELSMWKAAAAPYTARAGLFAAIQARYGLTGPEAALEGKHGLLAQLGAASEASGFDDAGSDVRLLGLHLKAYPIGYFTQPAVDAALQMRCDIDLSRVSGIDIETTAFGRLANADSADKWQPRTRETADHSLPYGVAVALLDGEVGTRQFAPERIMASDVHALMAKIRVRENPEFTACYPQQVATRISIAQTGRSVCVHRVDHPRGHACNPMSQADVTAKLLDLAPTIDAGRAAQLWAMPLLPGAELAELLRGVMTSATHEPRCPSP